MSLRIDDISGNSKFENFKLLIALITNFINKKNNTKISIDMISNIISCRDNGLPDENKIVFEYLEYEYMENYDEELKSKTKSMEITPTSNIQRRISKIFPKFENKEFLSDVMITIERELLK